jgi:hypothetical protein
MVNYSNPKSVAGSDRPQSLAQQQTNSESDFGLLYAQLYFILQPELLINMHLYNLNTSLNHVLYYYVRKTGVLNNKRKIIY